MMLNGKWANNFSLLSCSKFKVENSSGAINEVANTVMQKFWDLALKLEPPDDYDTFSEISLSQLMMLEGT
ncbi:hypothetical protein FXO38_20819 [Capsicum annuum]|uniref:Uncharacterized protein n=1 Tax=Capsicum annuum TaxID=4072 RepID=A0A2G2ZN46_CAPAN|nr:hypothetical protein FXO37_28907 [Capsicum annuum]KAF3643009.1 hypothetical protein FXO38_20819 [Capsicum annuum]PHT83420.1 hypothetical protein T459_11863 [Capsicum annuum]